MLERKISREATRLVRFMFMMVTKGIMLVLILEEHMPGSLGSTIEER